MWTGASDASVVVNGTLSGTSFGLDGGNVTDSQIVIGAQGVVSAPGDDAVNFDDSSSNSVQNNGLIAGGISFSATGAGSNQISNAGEINSQSCAILLEESGDTGAKALADANSINNSGAITARVVAIKSESSSDLNFSNSGVISAASNDALLFNDGASVTDTINNSGKIVGHGYAIESDADTLDIDNSGTIQGGLSMASGAAAIIDNLGLWQANVAGDGLALGAGSALTNSGTLDAAVSLVSGSATVENSGTLRGKVSYGATGGSNKFTNSGLVTGAVAFTDTTGGDTVDNAAGGALAGGVSFAGADDSLTNYGTVGGVAYDSGAGSASGGNSFTNSGLVKGSVVFLDTAGGDTFDNATGGSIVDAVSFWGSNDRVQNYGAIAQWLDLAAGSDTVVNGGTIAGELEFYGSSGGDKLTNTGRLNGGVSFSTGAGETFDNAPGGGVVGKISFAGAGASLTNHGTTHGGVSFGGAGDMIDNAGAIDGAVTLVSGGDIFTNAGVIDGAVTFTGASTTANTFVNSGAITGNFTFSSAHSLLTNSGAITGNVTVASLDTLINHGEIYGNVALVHYSSAFSNTGVVHGDVTLSTNVMFDDSRGEVTGAISAGLGADTLYYKGNFGNETIDAFIAGTGSNSRHHQVRRERLRQLLRGAGGDDAGHDGDRLRHPHPPRRDGFDHAGRRNEGEPRLGRFQVRVEAGRILASDRKRRGVRGRGERPLLTHPFRRRGGARSSAKGRDRFAEGRSRQASSER